MMMMIGQLANAILIKSTLRLQQVLYFLFFLLPESEEPSYWCTFSDSFIERFLFLLSFVDSKKDVPFPAILQVGER